MSKLAKFFGLEDKIDFSNSKLPALDGEKELRDIYKKKINDAKSSFLKDRNKRRQQLRKRFDFYTGAQESYTTIEGRTSKEKEGHANAVFNYAGRSAKKIGFSLANNPPSIRIPARKIVPLLSMKDERTRAESVTEFIEEVFRDNMFWRKAYRRGVFNQVAMGDAAIKTYPVNMGTPSSPDWHIKIVNHEKLDNLMVGWRGDDNFEYDFVIAEEERTIKSIEDEFGIKIPSTLAEEVPQSQVAFTQGKSDWADSRQWDAKKGKAGPSEEKNVQPVVTLTEYDDQDYYMLMVGSEFIEFVSKDNLTYPKVPFWSFAPNIPVPRSQWSEADIDDMMQPQIELNEASNDERDYIRVGASQKFIALNMSDFDPKSLKTGSGGVIFVDSPDGNSDFKPLATNVNVFPIDQYLNRVHAVLFDMGVPKVSYGSAGADSGRSKSIDYQSMVELLDFKRGSWEMCLDSICEKIQRMGKFYFGSGKDGVTFFDAPESEKFVVRHPDFNWAEVVPITQSDKIVNVLNKVQMGLPFREAFKELGYNDVEGIITQMKEEAKDPELMEFRSKMYQLTGGIIEATKKAQEVQQSMETPPPAAGGPTPDQNVPTMLPSNSQTTQPVSQTGSRRSYSTGKGLIEQAGQNLRAQGRG